MTFFNIIREIFSDFFGDLFRRVETREPPTGFQRELQDRYDTPQIGVNIRSTEILREENGAYPEWVAATFLSEALDRAGFNYDITWNYADAISTPTEQAVCGDGSAFVSWSYKVNNAEVPVAPDSNILLTNAQGGGCGYIGGNVATAPGGPIDHFRAYYESGRVDYDGAVHAILHEFLHNMGLGHDEDSETAGNQYPGTGWNEHGRWHQTPGYGGGTGENACGEMIPEKAFDRIEFHHYFHDCTIELMKELLDQNT